VALSVFSQPSTARTPWVHGGTGRASDVLREGGEPCSMEPLAPQDIDPAGGLRVILLSDHSQVGCVLKRAGHRVRVDFSQCGGAKSKWVSANELCRSASTVPPRESTALPPVPSTAQPQRQDEGTMPSTALPPVPSTALPPVPSTAPPPVPSIAQPQRQDEGAMPSTALPPVPSTAPPPVPSIAQPQRQDEGAMPSTALPLVPSTAPPPVPSIAQPQRQDEGAVPPRESTAPPDDEAAAQPEPVAVYDGKETAVAGWDFVPVTSTSKQLEDQLALQQGDVVEVVDRTGDDWWLVSTHARTHTRTHVRTHARTHARTKHLAAAPAQCRCCYTHNSFTHKAH
jgi:hypothetical protein